jgi:hypothetical protein
VTGAKKKQSLLPNAFVVSGKMHGHPTMQVGSDHMTVDAAVSRQPGVKGLFSGVAGKRP